MFDHLTLGQLKWANFIFVIAIAFLEALLIYHLDLKYLLSRFSEVNKKIYDVGAQIQFKQYLLTKKLKIEQEQILLNNKFQFLFREVSHAKFECINLFLQSAEMNNLSIEVHDEVLTHAIQGANFLEFRLKLNGSFSQFLKFINSLNHYVLPILVSQLSVNCKDSEIFCKLLVFYISKKNTLDSAPLFVDRALPSLIQKRDPFLQLNTSINFTNHEFNSDFLNNISCDQIKLVGFIEDKKNLLILAKLPNQKTVPILIETVFGLEKCRLLRGHENEICLQKERLNLKNCFYL